MHKLPPDLREAVLSNPASPAAWDKIAKADSLAQEVFSGQFMKIRSSRQDAQNRFRSWVDVEVFRRLPSGKAQRVLKFNALQDAKGTQTAFLGGAETYDEQGIRRMYRVLCLGSRSPL